MSASAPPFPSTADPLPGYAGLPGHYDECRAADGSVRPHWAEFLRLLGDNPLAKLRSAADACSRAIIEQDVSLNVYAGARSEPQPWPLDVVPHLVGADDWALLSAGLRQRAQLFNDLLADLYGPQKIFRNGSLPPELAMINPHFLRPCVGLKRHGGTFLHNYAVDIARAPDGQWWVLQDRLDAPSGLGYSLQNRTISRRALSSAYHRSRARSLQDFSRSFHSSLLDFSDATPPGGEEPRVVLLTPGPANETYFEHAYLARHLGYQLVEGADLTTRDRQVFLRTVGGLKRVDTILRRVDSSFCDPLELNPRSLLGVPGLVHAAQGGRVALANQLGGAALENTAMLAFLPSLCREVLGEDLRIPSVATWWCGEEKARRYVLDHLSALVVKPTFRVGSGLRYGTAANEEHRQALAAEIKARPWAHCGQERVVLGTTPAFSDGQLRPVPFVMRLFVAWHNGDWRVMPGGLTRFSPAGDEAVVSLQQGGATKDTWVLGDSPTGDTPSPIETFGDVYRRPLATPSRVADNLFWIGRYLERITQLARLLDKLDPLLRDEVAALDPGVAADALQVLLLAQGSFAPEGATPEELAGRIRTLADDPEQPGSLARNLGHLIRNLDQVKVRLPPEAWRILRRLRAISATPHPQLVSDLGEQLSSLETLATETLAHDTGWRFLKLGRRIERAYQLVFLARELLVPDPETDASGEKSPNSRPPMPREFRLQTLLHFTDSLFAYRGIYHGVFQPAPVLAWMLGAPENPRGLRFQADRIAEHLTALPDELAPRAVSSLRAAAFRLVSQARLLDAPNLASDPQLIGKFFDETSETLAELNSRITQIYFSHAEIPDLSNTR
ncbi:MAG TPA: circularly permuted type 2 ATP-grasp protein [Opitutaceae bacterium]|nr:circularly permuted type 2 ATP-grasp protein [Opitutaceae bacterium]